MDGTTRGSCSASGISGSKVWTVSMLVCTAFINWNILRQNNSNMAFW